MKKLLKTLIKEGILDALYASPEVKERLGALRDTDTPDDISKRLTDILTTNPEGIRALKALIKSELMKPEQLMALKHGTVGSQMSLPMSSRATVPSGPKYTTLRQFSGTDLNILALLNDRYPQIYTPELILGLMNRKPGKEQEFIDTIYNHIGKATQGTKLSVVYNAVDRLAKAGFLPDDAAESVEEKIKSMNLVERKAARQRPLRS
jgi:hypothetical protein